MLVPLIMLQRLLHREIQAVFLILTARYEVDDGDLFHPLSARRISA